MQILQKKRMMNVYKFKLKNIREMIRESRKSMEKCTGRPVMYCNRQQHFKATVFLNLQKRVKKLHQLTEFFILIKTKFARVLFVKLKMMTDLPNVLKMSCIPLLTQVKINLPHCYSRHTVFQNINKLFSVTVHGIFQKEK